MPVEEDKMVHPATAYAGLFALPRVVLRRLQNARRLSSLRHSYLADMAYQDAVVSELSDVYDNQALAELITHLSFVVPWRVAPAIYRFDSALYDELSGRDVSDAPISKLLQLPEWRPFIEFREGVQLPLSQGNQRITIPTEAIGAWIGFVQETNSSQVALQLVFLHRASIREPSGYLTHLRMSITGDTRVSDLLEGLLESDENVVGDSSDSSALLLTLQLALYLCESKIDITQHGREVRPPNRRAIQNPDATRRPKMEIWEVGYRVGPEIRRARIIREQQEARETTMHRGPMRPHVRRAHERLVPIGPRKRPDGTPIPVHQRAHVARQISRIQVHADRADEMPVMFRHQIMIDVPGLGGPNAAAQ